MRCEAKGVQNTVVRRGLVVRVGGACFGRVLVSLVRDY